MILALWVGGAGGGVASGAFRSVRRLMPARPHVFAVQSSDDRALAVALVSTGGVLARVFTPEPAVQDAIESVMPIAAGLQPLAAVLFVLR